MKLVRTVVREMLEVNAQQNPPLKRCLVVLGKSQSKMDDNYNYKVVPPVDSVQLVCKCNGTRTFGRYIYS